MARKKEKKERVPYNPYFGKVKDESHMAEKPFLTWLLTIPGAIIGAVLGWRVENLFLGLVYGAVMGIAAGTLLDKWWIKHKKKKAGLLEEEPKEK